MVILLQETCLYMARYIQQIAFILLLRQLMEISLKIFLLGTLMEIFSSQIKGMERKLVFSLMALIILYLPWMVMLTWSN